MNARLPSICMHTLTKQYLYVAMLGVVRVLHAVTSALITSQVSYRNTDTAALQKYEQCLRMTNLVV
jgi:hypothetical protein